MITDSNKTGHLTITIKDELGNTLGASKDKVGDIAQNLKMCVYLVTLSPHENKSLL